MDKKRYVLPLGTSVKWWTYVGDRKLYKKGSTLVKAANLYVTKHDIFVHAISKHQAVHHIETQLSTELKSVKGILYAWPAIEQHQLEEVI